MTYFAKIFVLMSFGWVLMTYSVVAQEASNEDAQAIQQVISSQIAAFQNDDGSTAYSHAAPNIKRFFPNSDMFLTMVKRGYQPVYRPRSVEFGINRQIAGGIMQSVFVTGPDGLPYIALYSMQRQPDGMWKINGVQIQKADGEAA